MSSLKIENGIFYYKLVNDSWYNVFYIDEKSLVTWEVQIKYDKNDIETFLPTILNNPNYETEGCSEKYNTLEELKENNPQYYK